MSRFIDTINSRNRIFMEGLDGGVVRINISRETHDECDGSRVMLFYKDGSKHTFRKVDKVGHVKGGDNDLLKVYGKRSFTNTIEKDIVETGTLDYTVSIPRHLVSHYVVHSNEGVTKTERLVKIL